MDTALAGARLGEHLDAADHQPDRHARHRRADADRRQGLRRDLDEIQDVSQEIAAGPPRGPRGGRTSSPTRSSARATSRSTSTARRRPGTASRSATSRTWSRSRWAGKPVTMTVEGRERYPVRVRYARDFRDDEETLKRILVARRPRHVRRRARPRHGRRRSGLGGRGAAAPVQVPLAEVADVRVVEGPSMIKSENGLLRAYVQLNVRDRDVVGFVEEAQRVVAEKVKLPAGHVPRVVGRVRAPGPGAEDAAARLPGRHRRDRADPLPDLQELDRRAADDDQRAGGAGRRGDLPVALRLQLQRGGLGRLHRLLRHGDRDRHRDARLPPRGDRRARRAWRRSARSPSCARRSSRGRSTGCGPSS